MKTKRVTRKRNGQGAELKHMLELPIYDSMDQMAAATKIPLAAIKLAKKNGCLFVRHGRCELATFLQFWFTESKKDSEAGVDWRDRDKRASALLKEIKIEEETDRVIDFGAASRFIAKVVNVTFFGELERIANEFPSALKGKDELSIHAECTRQIEKVKKVLTSQLDAWEKAKGNQ